jgi:hypothetical protein
MVFSKLAEEKKQLLEEDGASDEDSLQLQLVSMYLRHPRKITNGRPEPLLLDLTKKDHQDIYMYGIRLKIEDLKQKTPVSLHPIIDEHHERISNMIKSIADKQN